LQSSNYFDCSPNACIVEEIPELNKKYYTECKFWPERKVCGRET